MLRIFITTLLFISFMVPVHAAKSDVSGSMDYPQIGRLKGSYIKKYKKTDFDEYRIFTAPVMTRKEKKNFKLLEGRITRIAYHAPKGVSILEAQRNYENRLNESSFDLIFTCKGEECGGIKLSHSIYKLDNDKYKCTVVIAGGFFASAHIYDSESKAWMLSD